MGRVRSWVKNGMRIEKVEKPLSLALFPRCTAGRGNQERAAVIE